MKKLWTVVILILLTNFLAAEIKNPDKPLKGDWDLKLQKVWEIDRAGDNMFGGPGPIAVSDDGMLYVCEGAIGIHYIFDQNGKFLESFGKRGEGPGEVRVIGLQMFCVNDKFIIIDRGKVHYFTGNGEYIKSALNDDYKRRPRFFLNEDEFVYAPIFRRGMPDNKGQIAKCNLKTGEETTILDFSVSKPARTAGQGELVIFALTPTMNVGYGNREIYYGMNDSYQVFVADLQGKPLFSFSVDREPEKTVLETKRKYLKMLGLQNPAIERWAKILPDSLTYFHRLENHNDLIYVYKAHFDPEQKFQQVDIFSPEGKYLYRSFITPGNDLIIYFYRTIVIKKGHLYLIIEDEEGDFKIVKYKITLPTG